MNKCKCIDIKNDNSIAFLGNNEKIFSKNHYIAIGVLLSEIDNPEVKEEMTMRFIKLFLQDNSSFEPYPFRRIVEG